MKNKFEIKKKLGHFKVSEDWVIWARYLGKLDEIGQLGREFHFKILRMFTKFKE